MDPLQEAFRFLIPILYGLSSGLYITAFLTVRENFKERRQLVGRIAKGALALGWLVHTAFLTVRSVASGHIPFANVAGAMSVCAWMVVLVYGYLELESKEKALGVLVLPIVTVFQAISSVKIGSVGSLPPILNSRWFELHVSMYLLGYSAFAISCVSSVLYVFLFDEIHAKRLGFFYKRLPPLASLDHINHRASSVGFLFLTVGILSGSLWASKAWGSFWVWEDPKLTGALVTWFIYATHLHARLVAGWRGKRAAYLSIVGFLLVLFTFSIAIMFPFGKHVFTGP